MCVCGRVFTFEHTYFTLIFEKRQMTGDMILLDTAMPTCVYVCVCVRACVNQIRVTLPFGLCIRSADQQRPNIL